MPMSGRIGVGLIAAGFAFAVAYGTAGAQGTLAHATPAACVTAQTADPVPVRVRAPNETLELRIADTVARREYGLMCVRSLPARTGMIFVFNDGDNYRDFWMKNTLIPLDMVWVSKNGRVNDVRANVPSTNVSTPDEKIPHRSGTGTYVIELAAGEAARAGIKPGTMLDVSIVPPSKE
jgi:uncharacterized membrane protein (UPF0127 family)